MPRQCRSYRQALVAEAGDVVEDAVADEAVTRVEGWELGGREQSLHALRNVPVDGDVADGRLDRLLQGLDQLGWGEELVTETAVAPMPPCSPCLCPGVTLGCSLSAGLRNSARPRLTLAMPLSSRRHARGPMPKLKHLQGRARLWKATARPAASPAAGMGGGVDSQRCCPGCTLGCGTTGEAGPVELGDVMG